MERDQRPGHRQSLWRVAFLSLFSNCKKNAGQGQRLQTELWKHAEAFWREGGMASGEAGSGMGEWGHGRGPDGGVEEAAGCRWR